MTVTLYGASDDLIEIDGDIQEEWDIGPADTALVAMSDGCIWRIAYDGCWRITPVVLKATTQWSKVEAVDEDDDNYSDRLTIESDVSWVARCTGYAS